MKKGGSHAEIHQDTAGTSISKTVSYWCKRAEGGPKIPYYSRTETSWFSLKYCKQKGLGCFFPLKKKKKKEGEEGGFLEQIISVTGLVKNSVYRSTGEWSRSKWNLWLIN